MISILYLMDEFVSPLGGTERQFLALLERLDRTRFDPHLVFLRWNPAHDRSIFPCPVSSLELHSLLGWRVVAASREFRRLTRDQRFDVVQLCFRDASRVGPVWARASRIPVVVGSRRNLGYFTGPLEVALLRGIAPLVTHTVANSEAAARLTIRTEHLDPRRVSVIANGLDPGRFPIASPAQVSAVRRRWGVPDQALVLGAVANLRAIKNVGFLVGAAPRLAARFPNLYFVVLGEGEERERLESQIAAHGLAGRFVLPGTSNNVPEEIQAFDVAVLCSQSESSPNALIEYLAAGRPAIAAAVGGANEIVIGSDVGRLYPSQDEAAFVAAAVELLADSTLRSRMGAAARQTALERFSMSRMVAEHEALYERLLGDAH